MGSGGERSCYLVGFTRRQQRGCSATMQQPSLPQQLLLLCQQVGAIQPELVRYIEGLDGGAPQHVQHLVQGRVVASVIKLITRQDDVRELSKDTILR